MNKRTLSALAALLVALGTLLGALVSPDSTTTTTVSPVAGQTVTHELGGPGGGTIKLSPDAQAIAAAQAAKDKAGHDAQAESGLHETTKPTADAIRQAQERAPPGQGPIPAQVPQAAVSQAGCTTALVRNYSTRPAGARVLLGVIHWTGSTPTRGSAAGGQAIVRWFDDPRAQASSNYVTDQDGRCWLTVRETAKAWTQAAANPWAVSVEITNAGVQPLFQTTAARDAVVRLIIGWHHRWGLPYRYGAVNSSCVPTRSGILAHRDLGGCGGGHPDVGSYDLAGLIRLAKARDSCGSRCQTIKAIRAKHLRTHQRFAKNKCARGAAGGKPITYGYCKTLRARNTTVHAQAKHLHVSLAGTYK